MKHFIIIFAMILVGCSDPDSRGFDLNPGQAVLTIENIQYEAQAVLGTRMLGDTEYEQITLEVSDTIHMDILHEKFQEGVVSWTGETFEAEGTMVFLTHFNLGGGFGPRSGFLIISKRTESSISGIFQLELQNFASSCYNCPEDRIQVEGQFNAGLN